MYIVPCFVQSNDFDRDELVASGVVTVKEKGREEGRPPEQDYFGKEAEEESRERQERMKDLWAIIDNGRGKYA